MEQRPAFEVSEVENPQAFDRLPAFGYPHRLTERLSNESLVQEVAAQLQQLLVGCIAFGVLPQVDTHRSWLPFADDLGVLFALPATAATAFVIQRRTGVRQRVVRHQLSGDRIELAQQDARRVLQDRDARRSGVKLPAVSPLIGQ
jgi:hypothetical protein